MDGTISILGCGWYGLPLARALVAQNYIVKGSTTSVEKLPILREERIDPYLVNLQENKIAFDPEFFNSKILLICIPPKRSTGDQAGFPNKIQTIATAAKDSSIENIMFISSTAVYGDYNQVVTESSVPGPDTPSGIAMIEAERILQNDPSFKTTIIRFAGLIGPGRDPARFFAGKTNIPNGQAPVNLIHLEDCIGLTIAIIKQAAFGHVFNAACPDHPSKQEFYTKAAVNSGLEIPTFTDELKKWKKVATNHIPSLLNYNYKIPHLLPSIASEK